MMVTFVSQCEKNALKKTRQVLDAFADRIGDNTWQTVITEDGLITVKNLLRKTASKSTAVSCHWIRSRSRSDLIWVVGNKERFNAQGIVPVNSTEIEISPYIDKYQWQTISIIQYAATIAALFHDFGKANNLFQKKLLPNNSSVSEPYRHEWVSLRHFQVFVGSQTDEEWLNSLSQIGLEMFNDCFKDGVDGGVSVNHPLKNMPPFAQLVGWLIVTHHKLPISPEWKNNSVPDLTCVDDWFDRNFDADWNSHNCEDPDRKNLVEENWHFEKGLPVNSIQWRSKACMVASEAITKLQNTSKDWLNNQLFSSHLARLCLMMADHYFSAQEEVTQEWRNRDYEAYANTNRLTKQLKQKLDEHHIGVAHHACNIVKSLPRLNASLRQLDKSKFLENSVKRDEKEKYGWQDKAKGMAQSLGKETMSHGLFGINMASTGTGKTRANAKIMYAVGKAVGRIRFSVALGLRALTLQTGVEYQEKLKISEEDLAVMVGGSSIKKLFENEKKKEEGCDEQHVQENMAGSESQNALFDPDLHINYKGDIDDHALTKWVKQEDKLEKIIQAPVLVSTIDHLTPATEGTRGGKQIAPMLRLLSSDLVLDEPDDFGLEDLPALCRLVYWAGMLGSRVLLSTATMPPALAYALFEAYKNGWEQYAIVNTPNWDNKIVCAWFDEFGSVSGEYDGLESYKKAHDNFTKRRIDNILKYVPHKRKGYIVNYKNEVSSIDPILNLSDSIHNNILNLHKDHHLSKEDKNISIGLMRMANINPLVAVAKKLFKINTPTDTMIHYCVYHSRYPLAMRSFLESKLDRILKRHESSAIWDQPDIKKALVNSEQPNHIFVVLASPVAEVGRDHDYDWAIVEPSSMRSIIQLAGRVLRHRDRVPATPNVCLLNKNHKALINKPVCFERPGFESSQLKFISHDLYDLLKDTQYNTINSIPRIMLPEKKDGDLNLVELEHKAIATTLFGVRGTDGNLEGGAKVWWKNYTHWCGEVQRQQRFRKSRRDEAYYLCLRDKFSKPKWQWKNEDVYPPKFGDPSIAITDFDVGKMGAGASFWFDLDVLPIYSQLVEDFGIGFDEVSRRFGEIRLVEYEGDEHGYYYHPNLGIYQEV